jgi:3-oxoacyl-[acyl-carrier-protein] synthase-3
MDGREVFKFAVRSMEEVTRQSLALSGLTVEDVTYLLPHQANQRIMTALAKGLGMDASRLISNVDKYGNTSSASIPIALCEAWEEGRLKPGDQIAITAVGGGLSWGAAMLQWTGVGSKLHAKRAAQAVQVST